MVATEVKPMAVATGRKILIGLIGQDIQASRSPAMHETEAAHMGMRLHYQLIDLAKAKRTVADLPMLLDAAQIMGYAGLNITHPCKQAVIQYLDDLSDDARAIGAVNTVVFKDGKRIGNNTDWSGFANPFRRQFGDVDMSRVVLFGAGGAGSAVAHAILTLGAQQLTLVDIMRDKADALAANLAKNFPGKKVLVEGDPHNALRMASGVIHATATGQTAHPGLPFPAELLRPDLWVSEIVYFPLETELLTVARQRGCRTLDGGGMAVWQAIGAFELFTGIKPDTARMEAHFRSMIAEAQRKAA